MGRVEDYDQTTISSLSDSIFLALYELITASNDSSNYTFDCQPVSSPGENSYGQVIKVKVLPKIGPPLDQGSFILKISPKNQARRKQTSVVEYYTREVFMYKSVLNEYFNVQTESCIPKNAFFDSVPRFFYSSLEENDEFLIFEDLQQFGYSRFNRHHTLTYAHVAVTVTELAKFHAMSYILQAKKPILFERFVEELRRDNLFNEDLEDVSVEFARKYISRTIKIVKEAEQFEKKEQLLAQLEITSKSFKSICMELVSAEKARPCAVICHGDFWRNNLLYKYDENGLPISAKILDFQIARYASPVLDFVHFLFTCTEKKLRDKHFEDLKAIYHRAFSDHTRLFGLNPEAFFSYEQFEEHLRRFGYYGFCISIFAIPFIISNSHDLPDMDVVAEAAREIYNEPQMNINNEQRIRRNRASALVDEFEILNEESFPIFKERILGVVSDLIKYDMLDYDA